MYLLFIFVQKVFNLVQLINLFIQVQKQVTKKSTVFHSIEILIGHFSLNISFQF